MKISAVQMVSAGRLEGNLQQAETLIAQAVNDGAQLIVLPEYFAYYGCGGGRGKLAERGRSESEADGPARSFLADQARKHHIWLVGGTLPVLESQNEDSRPYSASFVFDDSGKEVARYNKLHLFDMDVDDASGSYRESRDYRPGNETAVVDSPIGKLGLSVCYDLRFPELYRALSAQGVEILLVPSAFTSVTGEAHWELLLRARAVENLCYVIGTNMGDRHHPRKPTWGGSAIIDPWGRVLDRLDDGEGVITADIDIEWLRTLRQKMPVLEHRRFSVVKG